MKYAAVFVAGTVVGVVGLAGGFIALVAHQPPQRWW